MSERPASTRFVKGRSGNPKGRPRNARARSDSAFDIVMDRTVEVVRDGVARALSVEEALQWRTYQDAVAGDRSARREVLRMIVKREKAMAPVAAPRQRLESVFERGDPANADAALLILGIATIDPARAATGDKPEDRHLLLEPWAVEAALSRWSALRLTQDEVTRIRKSTRDADAVRGLEPHA
jgi:hypothetical protein